jgi:hypothetical protein
LQSIPTAADATRLARLVADVEHQICAAAAAAGRSRDELTLIAASKTRTVPEIRAAGAAGIRHFGENYLQEGVDKLIECTDMLATWHFIGALQGNKTRPVAEHFDWVHTLDREKIARRLNDQCPAGKTLNVCLQVNIDADPNKAGVLPDQAQTLLAACAPLERLKIRGLMTILHPDTEPADGYGRLRELFDNLTSDAPAHWDSLSMGMSGDYPAAIAAGATHIRIGTALFGPRQPRQ